ncbi:hypothetical protein HK104_008761 [Borealophlyctis nickersoniae]|nr:hypothetical protein HK104_008761 [Borealophlyctis nickersoniae]
MTTAHTDSPRWWDPADFPGDPAPPGTAAYDRLVERYILSVRHPPPGKKKWELQRRAWKDGTEKARHSSRPILLPKLPERGWGEIDSGYTTRPSTSHRKPTAQTSPTPPLTTSTDIYTTPLPRPSSLFPTRPTLRYHFHAGTSTPVSSSTLRRLSQPKPTNPPLFPPELFDRIESPGPVDIQLFERLKEPKPVRPTVLPKEMFEGRRPRKVEKGFFERLAIPKKRAEEEKPEVAVERRTESRKQKIDGNAAAERLSMPKFRIVFHAKNRPKNVKAKAGKKGKPKEDVKTSEEKAEASDAGVEAGREL